MSLEALLHRLDRFAGGKHASYRVAPVAGTRGRVRNAFRAVALLLAVEIAVAAAASVAGLVILLGSGRMSVEVWLRTVVLTGMSVSLPYFLWRARQGYYWAYARLRLFSQIFPLVALALAAIPRLYPGWLVSQQIVFGLILVAVADILGSGAVRAWFPHPAATGTAPVTTRRGARRPARPPA